MLAIYIIPNSFFSMGLNIAFIRAFSFKDGAINLLAALVSLIICGMSRYLRPMQSDSELKESTTDPKDDLF
jgi:hypothetical protein